jgi:hypothetical protein
MTNLGKRVLAKLQCGKWPSLKALSLAIMLASGLGTAHASTLINALENDATTVSTLIGARISQNVTLVFNPILPQINIFGGFPPFLLHLTP